MSEAAKLTDERLLSIRKQYRHRAHGESRDENDIVAQELADVANAIDELLRLRSSLPPDAAGERPAIAHLDDVTLEVLARVTVAEMEKKNEP